MDALLYAGAAAHAKIKRYNGRNCVAHTERRENDKLLDFVIQAVHGHGVLAHLRDSGQNQIERVGHNGQQRLGNDGGQTDGVNAQDGRPRWPPVTEAVGDFLIKMQVEEKPQSHGDELAQHCGPRGTAHPHGGQAEYAVNQNGIYHDIDDCAGDLGDGGVQRSPGGLQDFFVHREHHNAHRHAAAYVQIGDGGF